MTVNRRRLLETLVGLYDEASQPVSVGRLASQIGADCEPVREHLEALQSYEMVRLVDQQGAFEPTITARDFLELDMDEDKFVIMEMVDEE